VADIFLGLFRPEDGGDMFLRTVGWLSTGYMALCHIFIITAVTTSLKQRASFRDKNKSTYLLVKSSEEPDVQTRIITRL
jgi:hypothetical protein